MKGLLIKFGLWVARLGGLTEPPVDKSLMGFARAGLVTWENSELGPDDLYRRISKTAMTMAQGDSPELRFAVMRVMYGRAKK